ALLRAATVVVVEDRLRPDILVRKHDLELVFPVGRLEQVELDRSCLRLAHAAAEDDASVRSSRLLARTPRPREEAPLVVQPPPVPPAFDDGLELGDPLEGDRDRELDVVPIEGRAGRVAEVRAIHPCLCLAAKALRSQSSEALEDELLRVARIVAVAGAMQDIKGLPRLRNRREQRVVAAGALALGV